MEKTVEEDPQERSEGVAAASDAYHDSKLAAEGEPITVTIHEATVNDALDRLCLHVSYCNNTNWLQMRPDDDRFYGSQLDPFDIPDDADGLDDLVGTSHEFSLDTDSRVVRRVGGDEKVADVDRFEPFIDEGDPDEFWRTARVEDTLTGDPPRDEVPLQVTGDESDVTVTVEKGGQTFEWSFRVPDPMRFEDSQLTEFIEGIGAGDPEGLDGHRVTVCLEETAEQAGVEHFTADNGLLAIVVEDGLADATIDTDGGTTAGEMISTGSLCLLVAAAAVLFDFWIAVPPTAFVGVLCLLYGGYTVGRKA